MDNGINNLMLWKLLKNIYLISSEIWICIIYVLKYHYEVIQTSKLLNYYFLKNTQVFITLLTLIKNRLYNYIDIKKS